MSTRVVDPRNPQSERISATAVYQQRSAERTSSGTTAPAISRFSRAKKQQPQPYINPAQQSETDAGRHARVDQSGISTTANSAKHIWHNRTSTTTSKAKSHLAQPAMMLYAHCGIINRQRGNTTSPVVKQPRSAKRKRFWTTPPCRPERCINCNP